MAHDTGLLGFLYEANLTPKGHMEFQLKLSKLQAQALADMLRSASATREVTLRINEEWTLYWKLRESENRAAFAHPEPSEWVASLALESAVHQNAIQKLAAYESFQLTDLCRLTGFSNFKIQFSIEQ